jgi:hypothetical protein
VWTYDPYSYAESSVATAWATHDLQIKADDPDKKELPWSSRLGVGRKGTNPTNL